MGESSSSYDPCYRLLGFSLEGVVKLSGLHFCRFAAQMRGGGLSSHSSSSIGHMMDRSVHRL